MSTALPSKADASTLVAWSSMGSLAVMFPKTRSAAYDAAVGAAQKAELYTEQLMGKTLFHLAGFGRAREQVSLALMVIRHMRGIKGFQAFGRGAEVMDRFQIEKVLTCFVQAAGCADTQAHCSVVVDERSLFAVGGGVRESLDSTIHVSIGRPPPMPGLEWVASIGRRTFPCRYLLQRNFRFQPDHPASEADQLQAGAVREGCDWCPNFSRENVP
ncbi:hypothetical protein DBR47_14480 [Paucibacter sp. KBW04]|uniref:hypothetical protein n=1 Tax=Paucibacter sp. KBW04 TaxID=2153361 RepID=UPI000F584379|nr:hypothetical protein [Paucibacter sp. KBW04]RQO57995.1 hypothetical protein DBR47_14480 [Paucibacter sp. KBW04]